MSTLAILSAGQLRRALSIRDLTDESEGPHALQRIVAEVVDSLSRAWGCAVQLQRASPVVSVADNYDRLHYPPDAVTRDERYSRYVCEGALLRSQTSAMVPPLLRSLALEPSQADVLLACPGLVYRRDCIDRLHSGEPHQMDLWRIRRGPPLGIADLKEMIRLVVEAALPGRAHRLLETTHPYTTGGLQIDVEVDGEWIEIGECGLALSALLSECGLPVTGTSGLAMGLGLDRILMLRKGLDDIRLLRSQDPRVAGQLLDLEPWRPVSSMPPVRRDLSLALPAEETAEDLGDRVRAALGARADLVEAVQVLSETPYEGLPEVARMRLGMSAGQKNVLVRVVLRSLDRTLTSAECNALRDEVYAALHRGSVHVWAAGTQRKAV
ncbi:MAG TPA: hypothetical protein VGK67_15515 [Myxococcales bacterium]|jgi:phenylalanyl-tRNA synthetase alpha chain